MLDTIAKRVEGISKAALALAGFSYASGLLIVSLHTASIGTIDVGLLQSQYVVVGSAWLFLIALGCAFELSLRYTWLAMRHELEIEHRFHAVAVTIFPVMFFALAFGAVVLVRGDIQTALDWRTLVVTVVICILPAPAVAVSLVVQSYMRATATASNRWVRQLTPAHMIAVTVLSTLFGISVYAQVVYPLIPRAYGGGQPIRAILYLRADSIESLDLASAVTVGKGIRVLVLAESSDWIVFRPMPETFSQPPRLIRARQSDVISIVSIDP